MFGLVKASLQDFKVSYKKYLAFELLYMLLASVLFVPIISFLFNRMLKIIGTGTLLNAEVYKVGLSFTGMMGMLVISFIAVIVLLIELGVLTIIAHKSYFQKNILVSEAVLTTLKQLPRLLGFGMFIFMFVLLLILPLIDVPTLPALLDFNMQIFLTSTVYGSTVAVIVYVFLLSLIAYLLIRSVFTLHFIFIEGKTIWSAVKSSFKMTKKNQRLIVGNLFILNVLAFATGFLLVSIISELVATIDSHIIGNVVESYLLTFSGYLTVILSLLLIPINLIIVTRLYYQLCNNENVQDGLSVLSNKKLETVEHKLHTIFAKRRKLLLTLLVAYLSGMFLINYTVNENIVYLKWDVAVASHRGDATFAPENSLSSIQAAIENGADAVEVDVQMTKDGVVVLNHDLDLNRVAGNPAKIKDLTYEELSEIDIGHLYGESFVGEKVPRLDEVLEMVKQENAKIIIDLKPIGEETALAAKVVDLIEQHEVEELSYVQSFSYKLLQQIRSQNSEIKIGQILYLVAGDLSGLDVDFYTVRQSMLTERFIKKAQSQNREVWVWTVNLEQNIKQVLHYDIDGIITDQPQKVRKIMGVE